MLTQGCFELVSKHLTDVAAYRKALTEMKPEAADREILWVFNGRKQLTGSFESGPLSPCKETLPPTKRHRVAESSEVLTSEDSAVHTSDSDPLLHDHLILVARN